MADIWKEMNGLSPKEGSSLERLINKGYALSSKPEVVDDLDFIKMVVSHMTSRDGATEDGQFAFLGEVIKNESSLKNDDDLEEIPTVDTFLKRLNDDFLKESLEENLLQKIQEKQEAKRWIIYEIVAFGEKIPNKENPKKAHLQYANMQELKVDDIKSLIPLLGIVFMNGLNYVINKYDLKGIKLEPCPLAMSYHWSETDMNDNTRIIGPHIHILFSI